MSINKIGAVALLALVLLSCRSEAPKEAWRNMDYPVQFSLAGKEGNSMRASGKGNSHSAALTNECTIENITVLAFTNRGTNNTPSALEKVITDVVMPASGDPYNGKFTFDLGLIGTYHLEIIANAYPQGNADAKKAFLNKLREGMSYNQFKKLQFDRELPKPGSSGFAMLNAEPIKVETKKQQPVNAGKIVLCRLACRFDIFNKLPEELTLTKVTLQNQINVSYIISQQYTPDDPKAVRKEYVANGTWFSGTLVSGGIYSYENPVPGATKLLLEGTYKDKPWQKVIEFENILEQPIATKRNHLYRIYLTKGNGTTPGGTDPADADQVHYGIEVLDWNDDLSLDYTDADVMDAELKMINPLAYVAEYNINPEGTGFVTDLYATNVSGYFTHDDAVARFKNKTINGVNYHLPSVDEWRAIVPERGVVGFGLSHTDRNLPPDTVLVAGKRILCKMDYKNLDNSISYMLRFKGTEYQTAWKYEYTKVNGHIVMRITSRNVADGVTLEDIATPAFWEQDSSGDIVRIFPASGAKSSVGSPEEPQSPYPFTPPDPLYRLDRGKYWSSTLATSDTAWSMFFDRVEASLCDNNITWGQTVRLFKDTL